MINRDGDIFLCDFGVSRALTKDNGVISTLGGTPFFMAPEILRSEEYNERVDIYSLGIVCIVLVTGSRPEPRATKPIDAAQTALSRARQVTAEDVERMLDPRKLSRNFRSIVRGCLNFNPTERCDANSLVSALESHLSMNTSHLSYQGGKYNPQRALSVLIQTL